MALKIDDLTENIMSGMDYYPDRFRRHIKRVLRHLFYVPPRKPGSKPEDAVVAVFLRIGDWMEIRDNLFVDAEAEGNGPQMASIVRMQITNEVMRERAEAVDAEEYCHSNYSATSRCAFVIDETLRSYGWRK